MASLAGPGTSWSLESVFSAGARLGLGATPTGESIRADADGSIALRAITGRQTDNVGVELTSDNGAVRVYAGGSSTVGGTVTRAITGDDSNLPGLILESRTNTLIKAARTLTLAANALKFTNTANLTLDAGSGVNLRSGDGMTMSSKVMNVSVTGRMSQTFGGPKDSLPTNTPLRSTQFTGSPVTGLTGGTVDQYECLLGDRSEKFVKGSHTTTMVVGDQTYTCASGKWTASAAANSLAVDYSSGIRGVVATGTMSFSASAGSTSISGSTSVMVSSQGQASLQGSMVQLQAKGGKVGGIISEADIDPISGRPFSAFRMGSPTHRLSVG